MKAKLSKKIFLSRALKLDSPFRQLITQGHELTARSLLEISYLDFEVPSSFDAVFFYSQKAIKHFMKSCAYDKAIQYGVMGSGSAAAFYAETGAEANIIGSGDTVALGQLLSDKWKGKKVVFPQAQRSLRSLESILQDLNVVNLVVYNNELNSAKNLEVFDVLIFTSPLSVEAYLLNQAITNQQVFAIGSTTAEAIMRLAGAKARYCKKPSMKGLYDLVASAL